MRKHYLDNIRWATVLLVVLYHTIFMYNHVVTVGVVGPVTDCRWQDALQYLLYPWFMVVLFLVSGASARYALDSHSGKAFFAERTRNCWFLPRWDCWCWAGRRGISTWRSAMPLKISPPGCPHRYSI